MYVIHIDRVPTANIHTFDSKHKRSRERNLIAPNWVFKYELLLSSVIHMLFTNSRTHPLTIVNNFHGLFHEIPTLYNSKIPKFWKFWISTIFKQKSQLLVRNVLSRDNFLSTKINKKKLSRRFKLSRFRCKAKPLVVQGEIFRLNESRSVATPEKKGSAPTYLFYDHVSHSSFYFYLQSYFFNLRKNYYRPVERFLSLNETVA